jgi:hypothetical protein
LIANRSADKERVARENNKDETNNGAKVAFEKRISMKLRIVLEIIEYPRNPQ